MAWQAIITSVTISPPGVTVGYYDDAAPLDERGNPVILHSLALVRDEVDGSLIQTVKREGTRAWRVYDRLQALKAQGPVPIPVPS